MENFFYELKTPSTIASELLDIARRAPEEQWETIRDQNLIFIDRSIAVRDPVINEIINQYDPGRRIMIFRSDPHGAYNWHRDAARIGSLNMLLHGPDSITLMGQMGSKNPHYFENVCSVPYKPNKFYLLNVKQLHGVFNYGNDTRYMFSISVGLTDTDAIQYDYNSIVTTLRLRNL